MDFTGKKYHDASFVNNTYPVFFTAKGAHTINAGTEEEKLFSPNQTFKVTKTFSSEGISYAWLEKTTVKPDRANWI